MPLAIDQGGGGGGKKSESVLRESLYANRDIYFLIYYFITSDVCVMVLWPLHFGWLLVLGLNKYDYLQMCVVFITQLLWLVGRSGSRKLFNHNSLLAVVTPTDRPNSVRNR